MIVGGEQGGRWIGGIDRQLRAALLSPFAGQTLRAKFPTERGEDLEALARLVEEGRVTPVPDRTFPMEQAPEAIRYLTAGHARGKVVVTI